VDRLASLARSWAAVRATLALAVALPLVLASHWGILASAQIAASDLLFKTRVSQPARSTVIIGIDQRSYRAPRSRRFDEAEKRFAELAQEAPSDGPVALYLERSRLALVQPPPADWDGVHVAQIK
jgi:CHASE2 domain-containing sensor protein